MWSGENVQTKLGHIRPATVQSIVKSSTTCHGVWEACQRECKCSCRVKVGQHSYCASMLRSPYCLQALSAGIQNRSPKPGPTAQDLELGYFLETGLQRAHVIHFKNG